jgi:hypothetical protein
VVVASLVRSNPEGRIGFLAEPERVNVLLSRARHGMILIGNAAMLRQARKGGNMWEGILDNFHSRGHLYDSLPAVCKEHGRSPAEPLSTPGAFERCCPNGTAWQILLATSQPAV